MSFFERFNWPIVILASIISLFGVVILVTIGSFRYLTQLEYIVLGVVFFVVLAGLDYQIHKSFDVIYYILCIILLLATIALGEVTRGAVRWINLGIFSFQASEIIKPLVILSLSRIAIRRNLEEFNNSLIYFLFLAPLVLLVFKQPDLGNAIIYLLIGIAIYWQSRGSVLFLAGAIVLFAVLSPVGWHFLHDYQRTRLTSFLDPNRDPLGSGYNIIQAVVTVGSGKTFGQGLGFGTQSKLQFLPERSTDFIFASISEEVGFAGSLVLLATLFGLCLYILNVGLSTQEKFGRNVIAGVFMMIFAQTLINIGMNIGIMPITGVTLPLVSSGGTSFIAIMATLGLVSNISACQKRSWKL